MNVSMCGRDPKTFQSQASFPLCAYRLRLKFSKAEVHYLHDTSNTDFWITPLHWPQHDTGEVERGMKTDIQKKGGRKKYTDRNGDWKEEPERQKNTDRRNVSDRWTERVWERWKEGVRAQERERKGDRYSTEDLTNGPQKGGGISH